MSSLAATSIYRPRRPERTDLHLAIKEIPELFCDTPEGELMVRCDMECAEGCRIGLCPE